MEQKNTFNNTYLADWIAGKLTNNQLKKLVSEEDYNSYIKLKSGIEVFDYIEAPTENTFSKILDKINSKKENVVKKHSKVRSLYFKSAIAVAASLVLFFSISNYLTNSDVLFTADFGEHKTIALLDNSEVILNAKSELTYNKEDWKNKREVHLKGEAFFKVQKGSTFTVVTDNGTVTVLGTQFNVNNHNNFFEVICYEGKVKVVNNTKDYILTPNTSIRNINGIVTEETLNLSAIQPTWIDGESDFRSVPLAEVIRSLENQFNIKINSNSIDDTLLFTGSFDNKNIDIALSSVFNTINMQYRIKNKTIFLSKK
ncbi:FecR family protein [Polaribacter sp.]|uniref:FecR family protein n=1 Tax=Polaribacter sp. TaxID=1920175 RepID=UPI003F6C3219